MYIDSWSTIDATHNVKAERRARRKINNHHSSVSVCVHDCKPTAVLAHGYVGWGGVPDMRLEALCWQRLNA